MEGYGIANLELGQTITPETVFNIGSMAKQFAAYAVWDLALQQKLSIDDDIRRYIPELPSYGRAITIRHLLHHTSGLRDYIDIFEQGGVPSENVPAHADVLAAVLRQKGVNYPAGTKYQYTNTNFTLLAEIVARVSKVSYPAYIRSAVFDKLGMTSSRAPEASTEIVPHRAPSYQLTNGLYVNVLSSAVIRLGAAGVYTNLHDLAKWDEHFYAATGRSRAVLDSMQVPGFADSKPITYASGLWVEPFRGVTAVRHSGSTSGYRAELIRFPQQRRSVAVLCNVPTDQRAPELAELISGFLFDSIFRASQPAPRAVTLEPTVALSAAQLQPVLGDYWDPATGVLRRLTNNNNTFRFVTDSWSSYRLTTLSPTRFRSGASEITVSPTGVMHVSWFDGREEDYVKLSRPRLTREQLATYAGEYHSDDLRVTYKVAADSTALTLVRPKQEDRRLLALTPDIFSEGDLRLKFVRDGRGRIVGVRFSDTDFVDIPFTKPER